MWARAAPGRALTLTLTLIRRLIWRAGWRSGCGGAPLPTRQRGTERVGRGFRCAAARPSPSASRCPARGVRGSRRRRRRQCRRRRAAAALAVRCCAACAPSLPPPPPASPRPTYARRTATATATTTGQSRGKGTATTARTTTPPMAQFARWCRSPLSSSRPRAQACTG